MGGIERGRVRQECRTHRRFSTDGGCNIPVALFLLFILLLTGCSGDGDAEGNDSFALFRFFHGMAAVDEVDVDIDDDSLIRNQNFGRASNYLGVDEGRRRVQIFDVGLSVPLLDFDMDFDGGEDYTLVTVSIPAPRGGVVIEPFVFVDDNERPDVDEFRLRFINATTSIFAGRLDVYLMRERDPIEAASPIFENIGLGETGGYADIREDELVLRLTVAGTKSVVFSSRPVNFSDGDIRTAILFDDPNPEREPRLQFLRDN